MKYRSLAVACVLALLGSVSAGRARPPAPEYALVELADLHQDIISSTKSAPVLRVAGNVSNGRWLDENQPDPLCFNFEPAFWEVAGTATPVLPTFLPVPRADKPTRARAISPDGRAIGGEAWDFEHDTRACIYYTRPILWEQEPNGWALTYLPLPPGFGHGWVDAVSDGAAVVAGGAQLPLLNADGTTSWSSRLVVWRRTITGFVPEVISEARYTPNPGYSVRMNRSGTLLGGRVVDDDPAMMEARYWDDIGSTWVMHEMPLLGDATDGRSSVAESGRFFGWSTPSASQTSPWRAVVWDSARSPSRALPGLDASQGSTASDQNAAGVTVGQAAKTVKRSVLNRAVRWSPPEWSAIDLNTRAETWRWTLEDARGIDDAGRIVGVMTRPVHWGTAWSGFALVPQGQ